MKMVASFFYCGIMNPAMEKPQIKNDWNNKEACEFYTNLLKEVLETIPDTGASMVLGPMFILKSPEENFALFEEAQSKLKAEGKEVFNQLPFVDYNLKDAPFKYDIKFELFYKKLIESGKISACYLLPDWDKSEGTKREIQYCRENGVPVFEL